MTINELKDSNIFPELLNGWEKLVALFEHYSPGIQFNLFLYENQSDKTLSPINLNKLTQFISDQELNTIVHTLPARITTTVQLSAIENNHDSLCVNICSLPLTEKLSDIPIGLITATMLPERALHNMEFALLESFAEKIELQLLSHAGAFERTARDLSTKNHKPHKYYDLGTGFLNRFALERKLEQKIAQSPNEIAVIYVGFANAKHLQSQFDFYEWENILKTFAERLPITTKQHSVDIARPNATDIIFLIHSKSLKSDTLQLCEELVALSKSTFDVNDHSIHLHTHIGVSYSVGTTSVASLINRASSAMIACKDTGQHYCVHSNMQSESQTRIQHLETYLLKAVRNSDLMLYFQPKVNPLTKRWLAAEALLRWKHPLLGEISSETLIHLAEKNGLIFEVGCFVLKTAIEKAAAWKKYAPNFKIAVNVSAKQLMDVRFIQQVEELLEANALSPSSLEIEVTESGLITDEDLAARILEQLHELGITLSLDDFGTGYASFNYLRKFPFDCIKIDKSFIQTIENNHQDQDIVRSIIQVAKKLDLQVIIEGVETPIQEQFIIEEGCDYGQGYLYGKPMAADVFEGNLKDQLAQWQYH